MLIHDSVYSWEGWGGKLRLASGKCRLRIYNRSRGDTSSVAFLKPYIVIVSDLPDSKMSVRSCAGHIATKVTQEFNIDPDRMVWIEFYPKITYGAQDERMIPEQYVAVDFMWYKEKAINPRWRQIKSPILDIIKSLVEA
ncbi:MAG: hypothetical protein MUE70_02025 [Desulfobacterales bacterium]|jgi:hypothetical protein|nr:hypothetical protein [Desulfobacterales bacterium]